MSKIYVVDDERTIADTLVAILNRNGYQSTGFYSAEDALIACSDAAPDALITDVMMPGMGGVELAMRMRRTYPNCRILMFSGNASTFDILENVRKEGQDFELLLKPVHPRELLERLNVIPGIRGGMPPGSGPFGPQRAM